MPADPAFPYALDPRGLTAEAASADHVAQLIEQLLFVDPGERVNRPQFGAALRQLTFSPGATEATAVIEAMVQGAVRQWLGDVIEVQGVDVSVVQTRIGVVVRYVDIRTQETRQIRLGN